MSAVFHGPVSLPDVPITRVRDLYSTFRNLIHEIAKFGIVGAFNYVVDAVLSNVFHFGIGLGPLTSKGLSTVIAATSSYFLNRHWTWRNRARTGLFREYRLFMASSPSTSPRTSSASASPWCSGSGRSSAGCSSRRRVRRSPCRRPRRRRHGRRSSGSAHP
jgi:hypothetical protein